MKSDIDIKDFLYKMLKNSELDKAVNGKLDKRNRPANSDKEDIVISVLSNEGCGQIQKVFVNINIYVKDQYNSLTKAWEEDSQRLRELARLSMPLFTLRGGDYHVVPSKSLQKIRPLGIEFEDNHTEHYINNKLYIEINNE